MPTITAKREGPCAACALPILVGEQILYERGLGARHQACSDREPSARRNQYACRCERCGVRLRKAEGELHVVETPKPDGTFDRRWVAHCVAVAACAERTVKRA